MTAWWCSAYAWHLSFGDQDGHVVMLACGLAFAPFLLLLYLVYRERTSNRHGGGEDDLQTPPEVESRRVTRRARRTPGPAARGGR